MSQIYCNTTTTTNMVMERMCLVVALALLFQLAVVSAEQVETKETPRFEVPEFRRGSSKGRRDPFFPPPPSRDDLPACTAMSAEDLPKYHTHDQCDRIYHNSDEKRVLRHTRYHSLLQSGVLHVPDEQTVFCPAQAVEWQQTFGHDTTWLVENQSSGPVVVIYVYEGKEYSAFNSEVMPPHHDPDAVLKPGEWLAINVFEGHIFYVREITKDGNLGDILLQHQPGLVPFKNKFGLDLECEKPKLPPKRHLEQLPRKKQESIVNQALERVDPEPKMKVPPPPKAPKPIVPQEKRHPDYERSATHRSELCHTMYKGFRNTLEGCPLHVYYSGLTEPSAGPMQCAEEFKFHLGLHSMPDDYMFDWHSRTKFESSYVGHTFVARLASNPDVLVDTYTVHPTIVRDCPRRQGSGAKAATSEVTGVGVVDPVGLNMTGVGVLEGNSTAATQQTVVKVRSI